MFKGADILPDKDNGQRQRQNAQQMLYFLKVVGSSISSRTF